MLFRSAMKAGAAVMVASHLGRPTEGEFNPEDSLAPVAKRLSELLGREVPLVSGWTEGVDIQPGEVVLLENCRLNTGEKKNNPELAKKMAALCDIFVHDAFRHRPPRRSHHLRHCPIRAHCLRRPLAGG